MAPGVNESHYLPKAKHAWDSRYASGGDLFLESHDSHALATAAGGLAARVLPLEGVAWLGRLASWMLMAWAWMRLTRSLGFSPLLQPLALIAWFLATKYGHWAGEWAIGGFEAKSIAYPCVLLALSGVLDERWQRVWIWLGLAVAWHPVVGGWAGLTIGVVWLLQSGMTKGLRRDWPWLAVASLIGLVGIIPAAMGIGDGLDASERIAPARVHVYYRLAHHLCPQTFTSERYVAAALNLTALVIATGVWFRLPRSPQQDGRRWLLCVAWLSVGLSLVGLAIDYWGSPRRPDMAAWLLRFYWFRWSDVAVPLAWTLVFWSGVQQFLLAEDARPTPRGRYIFAALFLLTSVLGGLHIRHNLDRQYPEADELLVESPGRYEVRTDRYLDWLAVCAWISDNTPPDSLWLTPKYQQTFKWYAGRAEVVAWKDVPQDNAAVVEWYRRVQRCRPPRDAEGLIREWTTAELLALSREYGFGWVLVDRTYQQTPPSLEILYPIGIENRSFAVFRIPAGMLPK